MFALTSPVRAVMWVWWCCLLPLLAAGESSTVTRSVLQIVPCGYSNASTFACIEVNNCSGREMKEGCVLVLSLPPEVKKEALQETDSHGDLTTLQVWSMSCLSVGIISLSGITGAVLWPIINSPLYNHLMTALIGLAVGSLTSTALFQLIPEAFDLKNITNSDEYLNTALFAWFSVWSIFVLEGFSKIVFKKKQVEKVALEKIPNGLDERMQLKDSKDIGDGHDHSGKAKVGAVAWMIILGDGLHNFIDGMSIGAGYCQSFGTGFGLSVAIACEEFPHELGDFAILLQSGMSLKKAICFNFLSACTAFGGLILGILLGQLEGAHFIFAFAGGLFLYISLTHLIPELKGTVKERLRKSKSEAMIFFVLQNFGVLCGTAIIYTITKYNDNIANAV